MIESLEAAIVDAARSLTETLEAIVPFSKAARRMYSCARVCRIVHTPHQILESCIASSSAGINRKAFAVSTDTFGLGTHRQNLTRLDACRRDMFSRRMRWLSLWLNSRRVLIKFDFTVARTSSTVTAPRDVMTKLFRASGLIDYGI